MDANEWIAQDAGTATADTAAAPDVAPQTETPATETAATEPAVAEGAAQAAAAAKAEGATPAEAQQAAVDYIEALLDDGKPFRIPKTAKLAWEHKGERFESTIEDMQRMDREDRLRQKDWTRKTMALADDRRRDQAERGEWERQRVAQEARFEALERERKSFLEAQLDPAARERLDRHLDAMANDPEYKRRWERGLEADAHAAVDAFDAQQHVERETQAIISDAQEYIEQNAAKYPGVDPMDVESIYAEQWQRASRLEDPRERQARIDQLRKPVFVDAIYKHEAQRIERVTAPLKGEMDALKKQLAAIEAERRTDQQNTETAAAIARSKGSKVGVPAGAAPAPPGRKPPEPFHGGDADARERAKAAWVNGA